MGRRGFSSILILVVVLGVFVVVSLWYYFAVAVPSHYNVAQTGSYLNQTSSAPSVSASSTTIGLHVGNTTSTSSTVSVASTSFFGGVIEVATTTSGILPLFLNGPLVSSDTAVIGVVESSSAPLTNVLIDPRFANGLAADSYLKIQILQAWPLNTIQYPNLMSSVFDPLQGRQINVVSSESYFNGFNLIPGDLVMMEITSCALYDGWPNFNCTNNITPPKHWAASPDDLFASWQGQNGAAISLAGASLDTFASNSVLSFQVNVTSGFGEFCPGSLIKSGPDLLESENGWTISPAVVFPSACIGPNATSTVDAFLPFQTSTSTMLTMNVLNQDGSSQTFFTLYPLPDGELFLVSASSTEAAGQ